MPPTQGYARKVSILRSSEGGTGGPQEATYWILLSVTADFIAFMGRLFAGFIWV